MALNTATLLLTLYCLLPSSTATCTCTCDCRLITGSLVQIDAGGGQVFGVNRHDNVYTLYGSSWTQLPGKLKHVTVGPAGVWGVNSDNHIYKLVGGNWLNGPGLLKQIDAGGNRFVSGANHRDSFYCLPVDDTLGYRSGSPDKWLLLPGGLKYYSCGPYSCWGVNSQDAIYVRKGVDSSKCQGSDPWKPISGSLSMIEVGSDGSVYGVNSAGNVYRRDNTSESTPEGTGWTQITDYSGQVKHVSYDMGHLWLVLKNGNIYDCPV